MIITRVKFYQGVAIDGTVITHASQDVPRVGTTNPSIKEVQISEVDNGILLKKAGKATLATWNNVQYVEYDCTPEVKKTK